MAVIAVPANVSSITLATSGVLVPASRLITCTAAEATILWQAYSKGASGKGIVNADLVTGACTVQLPLVITSITINGVVYAPDAKGYIYNVPAADMIVFNTLQNHRFSSFGLISG